MAAPDSLADAEAQADERPWEQVGRVRRDREPHRSGLLLSLGVVSVVCAFLSCLVLPGLIALGLGIGVWVVAASDLNRMEAGLMDPHGRPQAQTALDCAATGVWLTVALICSVLVHIALTAHY